jgi:saccharopine dehydrogenase-like NADP-dependent oxidoreductase
MKILALGGTGGMGMNAVKNIIANNWCHEIVIAGINGDAAKNFAKTAGARASWMRVDITEEASLLKSMKGIDLVMNTTGPYYRFGGTVLNAAINAGCDYIDVCDDWEPTLDMLALHTEAREAGITAIVGMGATPGISNMLAKLAIDKLDTVRELYTGWNMDFAKPEEGLAPPSAATVHGIHQLTGKIQVVEDGQVKHIDALQKNRIFYPEFGNKTTYGIGHPEAVTFPRYYKDLKVCKNVFTVGLGNLIGIKILIPLVKHGVISTHKAALLAEYVTGTQKKNDPGWAVPAKYIEERSMFPPLFSIAKGMKEGKEISVGSTVISAPPGGMAGATGTPLAIGARLLLEKKFREYGVFAPEAIVDPHLFFNMLAPLCKPALESGEDLLVITHSL